MKLSYQAVDAGAHRLLRDKKIVDAACGKHCAAASDGTVYTWGNGGYGRLGHRDQANLHTPKALPELKASRVSAGSAYTAALGKGGAARTLEHTRCAAQWGAHSALPICAAAAAQVLHGGKVASAGDAQLWMWGKCKGGQQDAWMYPKQEQDLRGRSARWRPRESYSHHRLPLPKPVPHPTTPLPALTAPPPLPCVHATRSPRARSPPPPVHAFACGQNHSVLSADDSVIAWGHGTASGEFGFGAGATAGGARREGGDAGEARVAQACGYAPHRPPRRRRLRRGEAAPRVDAGAGEGGGGGAERREGRPAEEEGEEVRERVSQKGGSLTLTKY